jgi:hypothetical protein
MKRLLVALAASLLVTSSPAWAHPKEITPEAVAALKPGVTTYPDVLAALGRPTSESFDSSGVRSLAYTTIRTHIKAASFIPYVGLFAGGATGDISVVYLTFGADGRLINYQSTTSQTDCSSNILGPTCRGGAPAIPPPSQHTPAAAATPAAEAPEPVAAPPASPAPVASSAAAPAP